jgi:tetratricopeptide (TPR) repeat protein
MADIFVSYTSSDRDWAFWIGKELQKLGHTPHIHEWEIRAGADILEWMETCFDRAQHALLVVSSTYLTKDYSSWERRSAQWATAKQAGFALPVYVEKCEAPGLMRIFKRCDLYDLDEDDARTTLAAYLKDPAPPVAVVFPGKAKPAEPPTLAPDAVRFPGKQSELPDAGAEKASAPPASAPTISVPAQTPAVPSPLPPDPDMIGRAKQREELVRAILTEDRPVIVPGGPGMGKTTLALAAAYDPGVVERFGARRFFVALDPVPDADGILRSLATHLGLPATGATQEIEAAIASACAATQMLVLLDNFETPFGKDAKASEALLARFAAMTGLRLIVTVRGQTPQVRGRGARVLQDIERLGDEDARALFLRHAGEQFSADPALQKLLAALDGHPLSIELLAANAAGKSDLRGVLADWTSRRDLLEHGAADDRLTSVRVSLGLSLEALDGTSAAHRLVRVMALLPDGMSEADSQTMLSDLEPTREQRAAAARLETTRLASRPDGRWRLLAPIRETLLAYYPPQTEDKARLIRRFLRRAAEGAKIGWKEWGPVRDAVMSESGNLDAVLGMANSLPRPSGEIVAAATGLAKFHSLTGLGSPTSLPDAARFLHEVGDVLGEANCIKSLGDIALTRSDHDAARVRYGEALPLYRQVGDALGEANCIQNLGDVALYSSDHRGAQKQYEQALPLYRQVGAVLGEAVCIARLGEIALGRSELEIAARHYEDASRLFQQIDDILGEANCIRRRGDISLLRSDPETARQRYDEALPLYRQVGAVLGEANCIQRLGDSALANSDPETARQRYEAALPLYRQVGDVLGEANCIQGLGDIALASSDHEAARQCYEAALPLFRTVGDALGEANCIQKLGDIEEQKGEIGAARKHWRGALALYQHIQEPYSIGGAHNRLRRHAETPAEADEHGAAARRVWASIGRKDLIDKYFGKE